MRKLIDVLEKRTVNIHTGTYKSDAQRVWVFVVPDSISKGTNYIFIEDMNMFLREFDDSFESPESVWNDIQSLKPMETKTVDYGWNVVRLK